MSYRQEIGSPRSVLIFPSEAFEGALMHPSGLEYDLLDAAGSTQTDRQILSFPESPIVRRLALAFVGELMATTAGEDTTQIKDSNPPSTSTSRTKKPGTLSTEIALGVRDSHRVFFVFPFLVSAPVPISENYGVIYCAALNPADALTMSAPRKSEGCTGH